MSRLTNATYTPLNASKNEIRVLHLHAGPPYSPIATSLSHIPLPSAPPYHALSYTWGSPTPHRYILLNGRYTPVTANLEAALRALRKENEDSTFWIDALCINQDSVQERNSEVPRMRDIYERAELVVAWLGEGNERSEGVIDFMTANHEAIQEKSESMMREELKNEIWWPMIHELLMRPWWQRLWVIQEVVVAKEIKIFCGKKSLFWGQLGAGIKIAIEHHGKEALEGDMYSALNTAVELRNMRTRRIRDGHKMLDWKELILRARASLATQRVDKIYGLLGLATQEQLSRLVVDYEADVGDVFKQFMVLVCEKEKRLDLICLSKGREITGLPSWAPDLSAVFRVKPLNKMRLETRYRSQFDCNGTMDKDGILKEDSNTLFSFSEDLNTLYADGLIIDPIEKLAEPGSGIVESWDLIGLDCRNRAMAVVPDVLDPQAQYVLGGRKYNAFVQTLVADIITTRQSYHPAGEPPGALPKSDIPAELLPEPDPMLIYRANYNRRFITSRKGYMGLVPQDTRANDLICVLFGCDVPVVIRKVEDRHTFVGECYIQGFMNGLAIELLKQGLLEKEKFSIY